MSVAAVQAEEEAKAVEKAVESGISREKAIEQVVAAEISSEQKETVAPSGPIEPTIIQTILDSLLKRLFEEE